MGKRPEKKKKWLSTKNKIIIVSVLLVALFVYAMYLGARMQNYLISFSYRATHSFINIFFWTIVILIVVLAIYIFYLVRKFKKNRKYKNNNKNK